MITIILLLAAIILLPWGYLMIRRVNTAIALAALYWTGNVSIFITGLTLANFNVGLLVSSFYSGTVALVFGTW